MTRLRQALDDLNQRGYALGSLKKLSGGINSAVYQAKGSDAMNYALKLYTLPSSNDPRNRCRTEKDFLNYLQSCQIHNTPTLIESNISAGWTLISWIEGEKPTSLQAADLQRIADFIHSINKASAETVRSELQPASEACQSLPGLIASIAERIKRLQSCTPSSDISQEAIQWITKTLEPHFQLTSQRALDMRASCSHWQNLRDCRIASPSDVGIHNTLRTTQGLHFLDFEYAGLDDLSKLAADWILQPEYRLSDQQETDFLCCLDTAMKASNNCSWLSRLVDIKPLIHIKWCMIMLNAISIGRLSENQLIKSRIYFENMPTSDPWPKN